MAQGTGSTLDLQVLDLPTAAGESFFLDNVVIAVVTGATAAPLASRAAPETPAGGPSALPFAESIRVRPQPMSGAGAIEFSMDHAGPVDVRLYDAAGREATTGFHTLRTRLGAAQKRTTAR